MGKPADLHPYCQREGSRPVEQQRQYRGLGCPSGEYPPPPGSRRGAGWPTRPGTRRVAHPRSGYFHTLPRASSAVVPRASPTDCQDTLSATVPRRTRRCAPVQRSPALRQRGLGRRGRPASRFGAALARPARRGPGWCGTGPARCAQASRRAAPGSRCRTGARPVRASRCGKRSDLDPLILPAASEYAGQAGSHPGG